MKKHKIPHGVTCAEWGCKKCSKELETYMKKHKINTKELRQLRPNMTIPQLAKHFKVKAGVIERACKEKKILKYD
jgi:hypothetical protein